MNEMIDIEMMINPEVTKAMVVQFERIRQSSTCNMMDYICVIYNADIQGWYELSELTRFEYVDLIKNYSRYMTKFDLKPDKSILLEDIET